MTSFVDHRTLVDRVHRATPADAVQLARFLAEFDEVSLQEWQEAESFRRVLSSPTTLSFCARSDNDELAGVLIGGILGTRGTINHVAVIAGHRGQGVGRILVDEFERTLRAAGIRRYFVFVTRGNSAGRSFWERRGLAAMVNSELTYEKDL